MPPTFPNMPRVELKQSPLELVVCQLRFPLVLGLAANQPPEQFHKEIRSLYPVTRHGQTGQVPIEAASASVLRMSQAGFWVFEDKDGVWTVSLGVDFLSLETRQYRTFDEFVTRFLDLTALAARLYGIEIRERLGLRYQDRVSKSNLPFLPGDWSSRIRPELLPLRVFCGQGDPQMIHVESRFFFGGDRLLTIHTAFFDRGFPGFEEDQFILDFDCYAERRSSMHGIREDLLEFKRIAYNAFRWAIGSLIDFFEPAARPDAQPAAGEHA